jgi:FdrA protein
MGPVLPAPEIAKEVGLTDSSVVKARVLRHEYRDSMVLMLLSARLEKVPGVLKAVAIMGTEANKNLLSAMDLAPPEAMEAGPNDLLVAVRGTDADSAASALARLEEMLAQQVTVADSGEAHYRSLEGAAQALPGSNLALISVPGMYAAREARKALDLGLHVFLFSDNVSIEEEVSLKKIARDRGLLLMGPDCGTALIGGIAVGFANAVRRGPIGIVGASGTGIQEISVLLHRAGLGVSHALGTGGRDLRAEVGAITTLQAVELLEKDPETEVLVLISKKPDSEVFNTLRARLKKSPKSVVACFLGLLSRESDSPVHLVPTLAEAAQTATRLSGRGAEIDGAMPSALAREASGESRKLRPDQLFVRGLFSGGSLCQEALVVWEDLLGPAWSNVPLAPGRSLPDPRRSLEHTALDLGDDFFTAGRPHPMIDPAVRRDRLLQEAEDPSVAVILLDVVLGYGSHPDMAGALLPAIGEARSRAFSQGSYLAFVAHVLGVEEDPQNWREQENRLRSAGVLVAPTNADAARMAAFIALGERKKEYHGET